MNLAADIADLTAPTPPAKYRQRAEFDTDTGRGEGATGPVRTKISDERQLLELAGFDPDVFRIVGKISQWTKTHHDKDDTYSFFFQTEKITPDDDRVDLPALYAEARRKPRARIQTTTTSRTCVPVLADIQMGKVASRGGTPELIDRLAEKREKLTAELKRRRPEEVFLPDINDLFENFESGGNPMFTNDLSLAQQMDLAGTELYKFVELACRFGPVKVAVVPSNHTAWRRGAQNLGAPGDDLGIFVHKQVEKVAKAARLDVVWEYPEHFNESMVVDVRGTKVGMVHGNQFRDGQAPTWWAKQTHGAQPVGAADILLSGHYHHLSILPTGRNPYTGRSKWHLTAPTLDNGSDWYRNTAGDDSDPGMLLFDVTDDGFDLQSLTVL
ncbi:MULTISPECIES: hypothetical protein [unclassified Microbacterium]|uniref:hypothetical protein n=1 Tax=unclassified Microbacterium TaxID=2609290 RepID=UPI00301025E5